MAAEPTALLNRATNSPGPRPVAQLPNRPDPVGELRFLVVLPNADLGRFRECTGLAAEIEVKDYNEGGVNDRVHKLPTRMKYPNLVLKRGVTYEDALLKWLWQTQRKAERVNVTVSLSAPTASPCARGSSTRRSRSSGPGRTSTQAPTRSPPRRSRSSTRACRCRRGPSAMPMPDGYVKAKLAIDGGETIQALFNPTEFTITKGNTGLRRGQGHVPAEAKFGGGKPREMAVTLLLDQSLPNDGMPVKEITDKLFKMMEVPSGLGGGSGEGARRRSSRSSGAR